MFFRNGVCSMKIEVWSDFACPFCYIGKRRLETAIKQFPHHNNIFIEFKSFELDPSAEKKPEKNIHELLAEKYNMTVEKAREMNTTIANQATEVGLEFNFDFIQHTNTFDAHRLMKYAAKQDKEIELAESLFKAYFTDSENISEHLTLIRLAKQVGLNSEEVEEVLQTCKYTKSVRLDEELAREMGIQSVPFFVFNEKYAISGAQPTTVFSNVIEKVWDEESNQQTNEFEIRQSKATYCCDSEGCRRID